MSEERKDDKFREEPETQLEPSPAEQPGGKSTIDIDPRASALLAYFLSIFLSFLSGLIFYLVEKENKFVRFHALQSVLFNAAVIVISIALTIISAIIAFVPVLGFLAASFIWLIFIIGAFVLWVVLMIKSAQGEYYKLPYLGDWADLYS